MSNSCGTKNFAQVTTGSQADLIDEIRDDCFCWIVDYSESYIVYDQPYENSVKCYAYRPFVTDSSLQKMYLGQSLTWRVGYNIFIGQSSTERVLSG